MLQMIRNNRTYIKIISAQFRRKVDLNYECHVIQTTVELKFLELM